DAAPLRPVALRKRRLVSWPGACARSSSQGNRMKFFSREVREFISGKYLTSLAGLPPHRWTMTRTVMVNYQARSATREEAAVRSRRPRPAGSSARVHAMNQPRLSHPRPEQLAAFARGQLNEADTVQVHRHLAACPACRQAVGSTPPGTRP